MEFRFNKFPQRASTLVFLVPSIACELDKIDITDAVEQYQNDLSNADITDLEVRMWLRVWREIPAEKRPTTLAPAIKQCDKERFPNLFTLLKIACTLPVLHVNAKDLSLLCVAYVLG